MTQIIKPTSEECEIIRKFAYQEADITRGELQPGIRHNLEHPDRPHSFNIRLVSDLEDWEDTDLFTHATWADFRKGFEAAEGGKAVIDFYVYSLGRDGELETNVQAIYEGGKLIRVDGTMTPVLWKADGQPETTPIHPFAPGEAVTVYNQTMARKPIIEGRAEIVRAAAQRDQYVVRFIGVGDNAPYTRFVYKGRCQDDPQGYIRDAQAEWEARQPADLKAQEMGR